MSVLDSVVYKQSFIQSVIQLMSFEVGTRRTIVVMSGLLGLICSITTDYHLHKNKAKQKENQSEGHQ